MITKKENLDYIVEALSDIADDLYIDFGKQKFSHIEDFIYDIYRRLFKFMPLLENSMVNVLADIAADLLAFYRQPISDIEAFIYDIYLRLYKFIDELEMLY